MSRAAALQTSLWKRSIRVSRTAYIVVLCALAILVYLPAMQNGFAYDDVPIIANDVRVTQFDAVAILTGGYWEDSNTALYRPLATLSYALDWWLSGGRAGWFHFVNTVWHAAATALLYVLLIGIGAAPLGAFLGCAVFAVHPLHVEAVGNVVGRAELMATAFVLAGCVFWCGPGRRIRSARGIAVVVGLFMLALGSKEGAVVMPGLLVLVDIGRGRLRPGRLRNWIRLRWLPLASLAAVLVLFFAVRVMLLSVLVPAALDPTLEVLDSRLHRFYTALQAWPHYARLLFFPRILLNEYSPGITLPMTTITAPVIMGGALLLACILGGVGAWQRRQPMTALSLLWFPVAVFPVSNLLIPIGILIAERTLYLPSAALGIGIAALATRYAVARTPRPRDPRALRRGPVFPRRSVSRPVFVAIASVAFALLIARTVTRIADWRTTNTIFSALVRDRPDNFRGVWHFARLATARGEPSIALVRYGEALDLWPHRRGLVAEAALYAVHMGATDYAFKLTEYAVVRWPADITTRRLHAGLLLDEGDTVQAYYHIRAGLEFHPRDSILNAMRRVIEPGAGASIRERSDR